MLNVHKELYKVNKIKGFNKYNNIQNNDLIVISCYILKIYIYEK